MKIRKVHQTCQVIDPIKVIVENTEGYCDDSVIDFAMTAAHESRSSLFGWSVSDHTEDAGVRTVFMYRD